MQKFSKIIIMILTVCSLQLAACKGEAMRQEENTTILDNPIKKENLFEYLRKNTNVGDKKEKIDLLLAPDGKNIREIEFNEAVSGYGLGLHTEKINKEKIKYVYSYSSRYTPNVIEKFFQNLAPAANTSIYGLYDENYRLIDFSRGSKLIHNIN